MKIALMKIMMMNSMILPLIKNPLSIMTMLVLKTIMISIFMNLFSESSWFSMMLFLMMTGGIMIVFAYMTSTVFNEKFKFKINMTLMTIIMVMMFDEMNFIMMINETEEMISFNQNSKFSLMKLFNKKSMSLPMFMVLYLLLTMIMKNMGPLRKKLWTNQYEKLT